MLTWTQTNDARKKLCLPSVIEGWEGYLTCEQVDVFAASLDTYERVMAMLETYDNCLESDETEDDEVAEAFLEGQRKVIAELRLALRDTEMARLRDDSAAELYPDRKNRGI